MYNAPMKAAVVHDETARVFTLKCCVSKSRVGCHLPTGWLCIPERRKCTDADCQESGELQWAGSRNREVGCISSRCVLHHCIMTLVQTFIWLTSITMYSIALQANTIA